VVPANASPPGYIAFCNQHRAEVRAKNKGMTWILEDHLRHPVWDVARALGGRPRRISIKRGTAGEAQGPRARAAQGTRLAERPGEEGDRARGRRVSLDQRTSSRSASAHRPGISLGKFPHGRHKPGCRSGMGRSESDSTDRIVGSSRGSPEGCFSVRSAKFRRGTSKSGVWARIRYLWKPGFPRRFHHFFPVCLKGTELLPMSLVVVWEYLFV
jgi:hypothetical protein